MFGVAFTVDSNSQNNKILLGNIYLWIKDIQNIAVRESLLLYFEYVMGKKSNKQTNKG